MNHIGNGGREEGIRGDEENEEMTDVGIDD